MEGILIGKGDLRLSFWSKYRLYYALCTYSCNTQCIQMQTRHLQPTRLFRRSLQDLTPKLQRSPCYLGLGSTPQLFCKSFTISPNENKTHYNPVIFFPLRLVFFSFNHFPVLLWYSLYWAFMFPACITSCASLTSCPSLPRRWHRFLARETLLCVLQHILLCSLSPLGPGAVHFLGNIPVLKRIGVIPHCKYSEASDMHKHKERKQGEF